MNTKDILAKVIIALAFASQVISGAAFIYQYDHSGRGAHGVETGCPPGGDRRCPFSINSGWYSAVSLIVFGVMSFFFAVAEVGLLFFPKYFEFVNSDVLRACVYVIKGVACLGVANDLGVAAGSIEIIVGGIMLIIFALKKFGVM